MLRSFAFAIIFSTCLLACNNSTPAAQQPAAGATTSLCDALGKRCHGGTSDVAKDCHQIGHAGDAAACAAKRDAYLAACTTQ